MRFPAMPAQRGIDASFANLLLCVHQFAGRHSSERRLYKELEEYLTRTALRSTKLGTLSFRLWLIRDLDAKL